MNKKKETKVKPQTAKEFKQRNTSKVGTSVLEQLKKATEAEKEYRKGSTDNE